MCLDCGCGDAHDDHGEPGHITFAHVAGAATVSGISVKKAARRIARTLKADRKAHPAEYVDPSHANVPPPPTT